MQDRKDEQTGNIIVEEDARTEIQYAYAMFKATDRMSWKTILFFS